jgi:hypothetical protein
MSRDGGRQVCERAELLELARAHDREQTLDRAFTLVAARPKHDLSPLNGRAKGSLGGIVGGRDAFLVHEGEVMLMVHEERARTSHEGEAPMSDFVGVDIAKGRSVSWRSASRTPVELRSRGGPPRSCCSPRDRQSGGNAVKCDQAWLWADDPCPTSARILGAQSVRHRWRRRNCVASQAASTVPGQASQATCAHHGRSNRSAMTWWPAATSTAMK